MREVAEAASELTQERAHAFDGDEEALIGASELFKAEDGRQAVALVDRILSVYSRLVEKR